LGVFKILTFLLFLFFQQSPERLPPEPVTVEGKTMGTSYRIVYYDEPRRRNFKSSIDSLLASVNKAISTYDPESEISRFNRSKKTISPKLPYLYDILKKGKAIYRRSGGAFDPTVMPLVNAWGFGPAKRSAPTASEVDSLKDLVGFNQVHFNKRRIRKDEAGIQLDMGGIGQGFGADVIGEFLKSKEILHMLIELGGEGLAIGSNLQKEKPWTIGILDPNSTVDHQFFKAYVTLSNRAFTTSGNYFNYRVIDGRKFGHTIDPVTGYPVQHSLLSASIFADDCTTADGWATAFMVMGVEKAISKVKSLKNIDAIFIYSDENGSLRTHVTPGLKGQVTLE
jgi:thiamine biosynthesis lipoprotein